MDHNRLFLRTLTDLDFKSLNGSGMKHTFEAFALQSFEVNYSSLIEDCRILENFEAVSKNFPILFIG